jgi:ATP-dependent helicase HepA
MSTTHSFSIGQRWLSNTESELGLGMIMNVDGRTVEVLFPATNESRTYTQKDAPLTRLILAAGDKVKAAAGWQCEIVDVEEKNNVVIYHVIREDDKSKVGLAETQLDHNLQMNKPEERLFNLQVNSPKWFDLRVTALENRYQHCISDTRGLAGARIALIPHQLYIASEVANRHAPRVLLADEVGLGKTIEAALIIHQQILTNRAKRVLITVPDSLVHQWLVEMLRKVNLAFSIFDESRMEALAESEEGNPFEQEQLVLCSTSFLTRSDKHLHACAEAGWDLLVVDEAHHLQWSKDAPSPEYQAIETLSARSTGLILLTATPDQLGHESHFARLRLLDPDRFYDYSVFLEEEQQYAALAKAVSPLFSDAPLTENERDALYKLAPEIVDKHPELDTYDQKQSMLKYMIDCHGTGRLLFRNRRANIQGFPERKYLPYDLEACGFKEGDEFKQKTMWLMALLDTLKPEKVLLICQKAETAMMLGETLRVQTGVRHTVFHEGMSIVERDKSAHYFADPDSGAQIMLCSEIGSEGRNFQFAHHLVLFDLPNSPDLLEQRIGRLDRIGQTKNVNIHVPILANSSQAVLAQWYHKGLNAFEQTCPTGRAVFEQCQEQLQEALQQPDNQSMVDALIEDSAMLNASLNQQLEEGRDKLLELSASGFDKVDPLLDAIVEQDSSIELPRFMGRLLDALGVQQEERDADTFVLSPTESMVNHLPGLDPEGMTVTYRRQTATQLDHVHFLTWDHPLVQHAMDAVLLDVIGKSAIGFIANTQQPKGAYWVETVFTLQASGPSDLQIDRFLPPTPIHLVIDPNGSPCDIEFHTVRKVNHKMTKQLITALQPLIEPHIETARHVANSRSKLILQGALAEMHGVLGDEVERLNTLKAVNPSVRQSEIDYFSHQQTQLDSLFNEAEVQLEAIRIIVNNP